MPTVVVLAKALIRRIDGKLNVLVTSPDGKLARGLVLDPASSSVMEKVASMVAAKNAPVPAAPKQPAPRVPPRSPLYPADARRVEAAPLGAAIATSKVESTVGTRGAVTVETGDASPALARLEAQLTARPAAQPPKPVATGNTSGKPHRHDHRVTRLAEQLGRSVAEYVQAAAQLDIRTENGNRLTHPNNVVTPEAHERIRRHFLGLTPGSP